MLRCTMSWPEAIRPFFLTYWMLLVVRTFMAGAYGSTLCWLQSLHKLIRELQDMSASKPFIKLTSACEASLLCSW